jgi:hypothetical protein
VSLACGVLTPATQPATQLPTTPPAAPTPVAGAALPIFAAYDEPAVNLAPSVAHESIAVG